MLRRWEKSKQNFGFIKRVDKVWITTVKDLLLHLLLPCCMKFFCFFFGFPLASRSVFILHISICSSRTCEKNCHILIGCLFVNLRLTHEPCLNIITKIQLVTCYQCCVLVGWASTRQMFSRQKRIKLSLALTSHICLVLIFFDQLVAFY